MVGLMSLVMVGWHPSLAIYTGFHALIVGALWASKMAARYELQTGWRERYGMDEFGVTRLGKAVTRGSASLPTLIMWALAPREGQGLLAQPAAHCRLPGGRPRRRRRPPPAHLGPARPRRRRRPGPRGDAAAAVVAVGVAAAPPRRADLPLAGCGRSSGRPWWRSAWAASRCWPFGGPIARFLRRCVGGVGRSVDRRHRSRTGCARARCAPAGSKELSGRLAGAYGASRLPLSRPWHPRRRGAGLALAVRETPRPRLRSAHPWRPSGHRAESRHVGLGATVPERSQCLTVKRNADRTAADLSRSGSRRGAWLAGGWKGERQPERRRGKGDLTGGEWRPAPRLRRDAKAD